VEFANEKKRANLLAACINNIFRFFFFFEKTVWVSHLPRAYLLGYAALYVIVAPVGFSGILGGLNVSSFFWCCLLLLCIT
jgi:hypothetical protein